MKYTVIARIPGAALFTVGSFQDKDRAHKVARRARRMFGEAEVRWGDLVLRRYASPRTCRRGGGCRKAGAVNARG